MTAPVAPLRPVAVRSRGGHLDPFHLRRQGDAQVAVVGSPNAGKSALVHALTGAATVVADYPFATGAPVPGMLACGGGALQLVDTPPVVPGLADGEGPGRPLLDLLSHADALAVVVDLSTDPVAQVGLVFEQAGQVDVRPVPGPLSTVFQPRGKGGIKFRGHGIGKGDEIAARRILQEAHVEHAEVVVRTEFAEDELRAQVLGEHLTPTIVLATRVDGAGATAMEALSCACRGYRLLRVDAAYTDTRQATTEALRTALGLVEIAVLARSSPDAGLTPYLVPLASDVAVVSGKARESAKGARVWGTSAERPGQSVGLHHLIEEGDRIFLRS